MAANNNVIEKLREAVQACKEISAKDLKSQKEEVAKQFGELQKAVYQVVDEKGVILANLQWKKEKKTIELDDFQELLTNEAEKIAMNHGYSKKAIYDLLYLKNKHDYEAKVIELHILFRDSVMEYTYWTLE